MDPITQQTALASAGAAGVSEDYWFARLYDSSGNSLQARGVGVDDSGNVYVGGKGTNVGGSGQGGDDIVIAKYDESGSLQWQRTLGKGDGERLDDLYVDGSGNSYICGYTFSAGQGSTEMYLAKLNSSGVLQWDKVIGTSAGDRGWGITADSSGNVYATGQYRPPGTSYDILILAKFNSSGVVQWQRTLPGNSEDTAGRSVTTDSSGNVYVAGIIGSTGYYICKWNSSGVLQWQTRQGTSLTTQGYRVAVDSSSNVYVTGRHYPGSGYEMQAVTIKLNSSGALLWQRQLGSSQSMEGKDIAVDSDGGVYVCCQSYPNSTIQYQYCVVKYNSSGTVQWQRQFGKSGQGDQSHRIVAKNDSIYVNGQVTPSASEMLVLKVPDDGSLTGTYGGYTYSSISNTDGSGPLNGSTPSNTNTSSSVTIGNAGLTNLASNLSSSTTAIE